LKIREEILDFYSDIKEISDKTANIDFLASLSQVSYDNDYIKPEISDNYDLEIV